MMNFSLSLRLVLLACLVTLVTLAGCSALQPQHPDQLRYPVLNFQLPEV